MVPPDRIDRFRIEAQLGRGASGAVYRAHDERLERAVAIKLVQLPHDDTERQDYLARLAREARSAARLSHPHIITVYDWGESGDLAWLAMELVEGETLRDHVERVGGLALNVVESIGAQLFEALAYAHARGVVHRDIKPANLMLTAEGRLKITDFGIALLPSSDLTRTGTVLGSPRYMSPEQLASQPVDGRADLFAVGVVLYELLGGAVPFDGEHMASIAYKILYETPVPLQTLNPDVPPALADVVMRCLAKAPDARYPDAAAAGAAWAASQRAAEARPPATTPQPARHLPMRLLGLGAALLLAVAGLLVLRPSVPAPSLAAAAPASQHPAAPLPTTADGSTAAENSKSSVTPVRDTSPPARRPEAVTQHAPVPRQKAQRSPDAAGNESKPLVAHKSQDESRKPGSFWQRHWGCLRKGDCPPPRKPPPRDR